MSLASIVLYDNDLFIILVFVVREAVSVIVTSRGELKYVSGNRSPGELDYRS